MEIQAQEDDGRSSDDQIIRASEDYVRESEEARLRRIGLNRENWDIYHLNQDFGHKRPGQSREFLAKQAMAVEQITEFFQQGLVDIDDWWRCDYKSGIDPQAMPITKEEIKKITDRYLDKLKGGEGFMPFVGDSVKSGLLGAVIIVKVHGNIEKKPFYVFENKVKSMPQGIQKMNPFAKTEFEPTLKRGFKDDWELKLDLLQPFEYGVDPSPRKLYEYQEIYLDYFEVKSMAEGPNKIYDLSILEAIQSEMSEEWERRIEVARQTGQPIPAIQRKKIKIQEFWGTIIDMEKGDILHENVVWTIANDRHILQQPKANPFWHGQSPFVVAPIIRVPGSRWHKALMDAPTKHNIALNEIYNLILDSGMQSVYGLKQYRPDWMEDESSAAEGFLPGQSVAVTSDCPVGAKVVERIDTGSMSQESLAVYNLTNAEFNASSLTNDLRMGVMPNRAVKATEVVESSNSINSIFTGLSKVLEQVFIAQVLELSWKTILQNAENLDSAEMQATLGQDRALAIANLSKQERYAKCIDNTAFSVFGVTKTLSKMKDFKKLTALLQTISGSPVLLNEFASEYSMPKLLQQIMTSLDVNTEKLSMDPQEKIQAQMRIQQSMQQQAQMKAGGNIGAQGASGDQGQIPQATTGPSRPTTESMLPSRG